MRRVEALQRELATLVPTARIAHGERPLELPASGIDAPRLVSASIIEGVAMQAHQVGAPPIPGFRAFLDGTQRSQVVSHLGNVPVVFGQASAVVRERVNRRMQTWGAPLAEQRLYVARSAIPAVMWNTLVERFGHELVDTSSAEGELHPFALRDAAYNRVQAHRESLEQRLAERWCSSEHEPLFIDGGISGSDKVAVAGCTVGVVKSHRTLYADAEALDVVLALGPRERSSVFLIAPPKRSAVASWYLRMRDPAGHDPMWGLVRVEVGQPDPGALHRIGDRAEEVSRWILAEASPLALPDSRWDKMVYGIRDCEEFLRATVWA